MLNQRDFTSYILPIPKPLAISGLNAAITYYLTNAAKMACNYKLNLI